ncbi:MAG: preprotein translocase subunit SecA [Propionibacteriaceae bacterium]|nr:preprotein translocase subunit SecA [Propionibacteriaceae bacterium]
MHLGEGRQIRRLAAIADQVNLVGPEFEAMSDDELRAETGTFRERLDHGESLDKVLPEAFAVVREAATRVLGKRHYDVQLMGGAALHLGNIAEMKTGEGKTLVATLPSYLNALTGKGVHVVTVNDYLAKYQSEQMGRVHHFLGLETGVILQQMTPAQRRDAYAADITYGTNNEFGFDYLRDNMALSLGDCVQRGHNYAIVDEVDSILIDEARTPLIISGPAEDNQRWYPVFARLAKRMKRDTHYEVDEKKKTVSVLEPGITLVEDSLGIENLYESANTPLISYLSNAVRAKELFKRDKDYMVTPDNEVLIVDEFTGRTLVGRRYSEGLHQALEAKEGVRIREEFQTLATITLQNYFRMYDKLAGMTGTAKTEESEFQKIYGLGVLPIATNKPMIRADQPDLIYRTEDAKFDAVVADVVERHEAGQPVLLGTASVAKSELLSQRLVKAGVKHEVLNAKNHAREAAIIALAGRRGAVTVATNMAGRGTDIILGGNAEFLADAALRQRGLDPRENAEEYEAAWPPVYAELEKQTSAEHDEVVGLGGLYVVGSERHESRRIDNQLRGRSGRQGDPGESRFYLSLADDLMRLFKADLIERVLLVLNVPDDVPIENKQVTNSVASAQEMVESQNFEMRKNVLKYDDVMNRQRHTIYGDRRKVLEGADVDGQLRVATSRVVEQVVRRHTEGFLEDWDLDALWAQLRTLYPVGLDLEEYAERTDLTTDSMVDDFVADADAAYDRREEQLTPAVMRELERRIVMTVLDRKWREHLYEMDYLREGIGLRAMAQRDPLVEYQREGGDMFNAMMDAFLEESIGFVFNLEVNVAAAQQAAPQVGVVTGADGAPVDVAGSVRAPGLTRAKDPASLTYTAPDEDGQAVRTAPAATASGPEGPQADGQQADAGDAGVDSDDKPRKKLGPNQRCYCGSGKKFKHCHGRPA